MNTFGHTPLELMCNSLRAVGIGYYTLVKQVKRPTKENPKRVIYLVVLYINGHNDIGQPVMYFTSIDQGGDLCSDAHDYHLQTDVQNS